VSANAASLHDSRECERVGCGREFRPSQPGQRYCSTRCTSLAGMASRSHAAQPLAVDQPEPTPTPPPVVSVAEEPATEPPAAAERVCAYDPCGKPVMRPDTHVGWYSRFCSREHASTAKAEREDAAPPKPTRQRRTAEPDLDMHRRYFDLLMDRAAAADPPSEDLLNRIEHLLEVLS
jgi:hypothetical protein